MEKCRKIIYSQPILGLLRSIAGARAGIAGMFGQRLMDGRRREFAFPIFLSEVPSLVDLKGRF